MADFKLKKGYNIRIAGEAERSMTQLDAPDEAAIQPVEFMGVKPRLNVHVEDPVKIGTVLFTDKANPELSFVSPLSGKVKAINRGERRVILEIIVENDRKNATEIVGNWVEDDVRKMSREDLVANLLKGGMWPLIFQRPFGKIANPAVSPRDIFISGLDTAPLAADPAFIMQGEEDTFQLGLDVLKKLTDGEVYLSLKKDSNQPAAFEKAEGVVKNTFSGPHPAGNVGVQIHHIKPIKAHDVVWHLAPYAVSLIGKFFKQGYFANERIVATAGSALQKGQYFKTVVGTPLRNIINDDYILGSDIRFISGNVLTGRKARFQGYLSFYNNLISVIPEGKKARSLMGWFLPGFNVASHSRTFLSNWIYSSNKRFVLDTLKHGSKRAFIQNTEYESVMPMDVLPVPLMKSIMAEDIEEMEGLGIRELTEEDVALCSYVCLSKTDFAGLLRKGLDLIEQEG